jgi:hypothetical protein
VREESFRPRSPPPVTPVIAVFGVRRPDEEAPQAEQRQQDAKANAPFDDSHSSIMKNAAMPSSDRRRDDEVGTM